MHVLGPTLEYIARDKAHIIRKDTPAFTCIQDARVLEVLTERAQSVGATLDVAQPFTGRVGMRGRHQRSNAGLALLAWRRLAEMLCVSVDGRKVERALAEAFVPGRLQVVEQEGAVWYLDGAHNEPALLALGRALRDEGLSPETLVVSCMRDKDLERMAPLLRELCPGQILCPDLPWYERMLPGPELARILGERASSALSPVQGFERAAQGKGPILVCGSLYLLAEFYRLYPQHLSRSTS
jgi:dihydrofolate synthase/folylpolyglutamate synthase